MNEEFSGGGRGWKRGRIERLRFTFATNGKRQTQVENFSE